MAVTRATMLDPRKSFPSEMFRAVPISRSAHEAFSSARFRLLCAPAGAGGLLCMRIKLS